jgi:hypothetical protein
MKKLLTLIFLILLSCNLFAQDSTRNNFSHHSISASFSQDYIFDLYVPDYGGHNMPPIYRYTRIGFGNTTFNYSLSMNYTYSILKWLSVSAGAGYSKQIVGYGHFGYVNLSDSIIDLPIHDCHINYLSIPVGIKFHFINKFFIRPFISIDLLNSFSFNERVREVTTVRDVYNNYYSKKWHYYNFRPQFTLGFEVYIKKHYFLGFDAIYRHRPWSHPDLGMTEKLWYSNLNFGGHFGYAF